MSTQDPADRVRPQVLVVLVHMEKGLALKAGWLRDSTCRRLGQALQGLPQFGGFSIGSRRMKRA